MGAARAVSRRHPAGLLRGLSGLLAGGMVAVEIGLVVAWVLAARDGSPGPGAPTLVGYAATAVAAVLAQRHADRRPGGSGTVAALGVVALSAVALAVWLLV
jgi:hypothetical protein